MKNFGRVLSPTHYRLACLLTGGLLAIPGCREDTTAPSIPESAAGATSVGSALATARNTWTPRAPIPIRDYRNFAAGTAPNRAGQPIVYLFGGEDDNGTGFPVSTYNVATNVWGNGGGFSFATVLNGVGRIGNRFYFTGGEKCCGSVDDLTYNTTWAYDFTTRRQFQRADLPRATKDGVTGVIDGKLYVLAGSCSGESTTPGHCTVGGPVRQFYRYDPGSNTWVFRRQSPHFHFAGGGAVIDGKFYVVGGGQGSVTYLDMYDPASNTWQTRAPMPAPNGVRLSAAVIQHRMFVVSLIGFNPDFSPIIQAFSYDPSTNTWRSKAVPPVYGPIVRVDLNGQARLFLSASEASYLYTP